MTTLQSGLGFATACLLAVVFSVPVSPAHGQPPQTRPDAGRGGDGPADRDAGPQLGDRPGDWPQLRQPGARGAQPEEGARSEYSQPRQQARIVHPPPSRNWWLGIRAERAPRGVRVSDVLFGSPADRAGLEVGDYILDVGGYVVGEYQGTYYPLAMAMDYGAGPNGWAELLVWNKRTFQEQTLWVQFRRR